MVSFDLYKTSISIWYFVSMKYIMATIGVMYFLSTLSIVFQTTELYRDEQQTNCIAEKTSIGYSEQFIRWCKVLDQYLRLT